MPHTAFDAYAAEAIPQDESCPIYPFKDSDPKAWYHDGVHWAVESGLIYGMTETTLAPKGDSTRAQAATILMRFCEGTRE